MELYQGIDKLTIIEVEDNFIIYSDECDNYCVLDQNAYNIITALQKGTFVLPESRSERDAVETFLDNLENLGLLTKKSK